MSKLADNLTQVQARITAACQQYHKTAPLLLAVSKTRSAAEIRALYALGIRHFGENYLQEALDKQQELTDLAIVWHFIGPIQSNKTRAIAENFDWIHSVDREKVATRLSVAVPSGKSLNVCVQVNIDHSPTKSGLLPEQLTPFLAECLALPQLSIRGLMAIPDPGEGNAQGQAFQALAKCLQQAQQSFPGAPLDTLSMGMSGDLELAIAAGSTIVRVGTDIFGARANKT
ncbi:YggS family pyridoxal phosphate-dependent enzyme [Halioxenophilus sp. WMMB6]|uniref:YggS family pyridoxal phosphate-dependent enzyme n=1 Tax=Halioxenophilus sp. WMMB6 TaxID=3073815 RepID=UPI00295E55FD|nr:YggS family pyridoxal phosphate-dependent enzyme [Halioxenophilus sp. WMMB6]